MSQEKPRVEIYETNVTRSFVGFDMTQKATHEFDVVVSDFSKDEMPKAAKSLKVVLLSAYTQQALELRKARVEIERLRAIRERFEVLGTDSCTTCDTGRITIYRTESGCIDCQPKQYTSEFVLNNYRSLKTLNAALEQKVSELELYVEDSSLKTVNELESSNAVLEAKLKKAIEQRDWFIEKSSHNEMFRKTYYKLNQDEIEAITEETIEEE